MLPINNLNSPATTNAGSTTPTMHVSMLGNIQVSFIDTHEDIDKVASSTNHLNFNLKLQGSCDLMAPNVENPQDTEHAGSSGQTSPLDLSAPKMLTASTKDFLTEFHKDSPSEMHQLPERKGSLENDPESRLGDLTNNAKTPPDGGWPQSSAKDLATRPKERNSGRLPTAHPTTDRVRAHKFFENNPPIGKYFDGIETVGNQQRTNRREPARLTGTYNREGEPLDQHGRVVSIPKNQRWDMELAARRARAESPPRFSGNYNRIGDPLDQRNRPMPMDTTLMMLDLQNRREGGYFANSLRSTEQKRTEMAEMKKESTITKKSDSI